MAVTNFFKSVPLIIAVAACLPGQAYCRPLKIGISLPLQGEIAEYGTAAQNGIRLAVTDASSAFEGVGLIYEDNRYDAKTAASVVQKLINIDKVDLVYSWGEIVLFATADILEKAKVPTLAMSVDPLPAANRKYILRSVNDSTLFIDTLSRYLRTKGYKRLAVIKTEDPFLNSLTDALRNTLTGSENMQVLVSFSPGDSDFKSAIARLRGGAFDAVGLYLFPGQVSSFYRQLAAVNLKIPTFGSDIFDSRTEIANAGPAMQGAVFPNVEVPEEFRTRYREMFGNDLQLAYGYNAYITFKAIAQLVRLRDESPQKEFSNLLLEPSAYTGLKEFELKKDKFGGIYFDFPLEMREVRGEGTELVTATYIPIFKNKN